MRFRFHPEVLSCLLLLVGTAGAQQSPSEAKFVTVPREVGLVTVAYQPDCPLRFERVSFLAGIEGGGTTTYDLRNSGTKSIRAFTVGDSIGNRLSWDVPRSRGPVPPGELAPLDGDQTEPVALTGEVRQKLKLQEPMKGLVVLMVIRVEFTDGTVYDDERVFKSMLAYMDNLQSKLNLLESLKNKPK